MTASEIMTYIDDIKEYIPDAVYLNLANMLKKQEIKKVDDYKLVEICYITTSLRRGDYEIDEVEEDYIVDTQFKTKKVYVNKYCNSIKQGDAIDFSNHEGLEIIAFVDSNTKYLYNHSKTEDKISVSYEKYILVSIKDC